MSTYNAGAYLRETMSSILDQTYRSFEFIIVDDGSSDDTFDILQSYSNADARIRLIAAPHAGLTSALNRGLRECRGAFIARMDADDIAFPTRLETQIHHLEASRHVDILCADASIIDSSGRIVGAHRMGRWDNHLLGEGLLSKRKVKPIIHPTVMMRRSVAESLGGYRDFLCAEDHDFWLRAIERFTFGNIGRPLLYYRVHKDAVSRSGRMNQATSSVMSAACHYVRLATGVDMFDQRKELFDRLSSEARNRLQNDLLAAEYDFRAARLRMLTESRVRGSLDIGVALWRHGTRALPSQSRRNLSKLIESLARKACVEISSHPSAPLSSPSVGH